VSLPDDLSPEQDLIKGLTSTKNCHYIESVFDLSEDRVEKLKRIKPKALGIRCRRTDCDKALHCFDAVKVKPKFPKGKCQECGKELVKWDEAWLRDIRDTDQKFAFFETEWIRHFFFHVPITNRIRKYAQTHGLEELGRILEKQLRNKKMLRYIPALDSTQTKMLDGTIVHWARHAVACCCRRCMSYWHNIPLEQELTDADINYFRALVLKFISKRIPELSL